MKPLVQPLIHWPKQAAQFSSNGVALLSLQLSPPHPRTAARGAARKALRQILADLLACSVEQIVLLETAYGPRLADATQKLSISLSYALNQCVIGVARDAIIGVDIVRIEAVPEIANLARLYLPEKALNPDNLLGMGITQNSGVVGRASGLHESNPKTLIEHTAAFASAWADMEAASKCLGLALTEMNPPRQQQLETCERLNCQQLEGYRIALALRLNA